MTKNSRKKISALDALSLALSSVAPETDLAAYEHHTKQYFEDCQPAGQLEIHLVKVIARNAWWLRRIPNIETILLNAAMDKRQESVSADQPEIDSRLALAMAFCDPGKVLDKLSLHHERLSILFGKSVKQLHKIQADRRAVEKKQMQDAACGPAHDGFVLSAGKNETRVRRNDRLKEAWNAPYYRA